MKVSQLALSFTLLLSSVNAFIVHQPRLARKELTRIRSLSLELEKPFGLILEETDDESGGVMVESINDGGSAALCGIDLIGRKLMKVDDVDVTELNFDEVMDLIINAESPVDVEFNGPNSLPVGTPVSITVEQDGKETITIESNVGQNLRQVLLENNVELYRGMKKKFGNCGGGGQCTFCAVSVEEEGWVPRSEYEDNKLSKYPSSVRLACLNNIQGPATIQVE